MSTRQQGLKQALNDLLGLHLYISYALRRYETVADKPFSLDPRNGQVSEARVSRKRQTRPPVFTSKHKLSTFFNLPN